MTSADKALEMCNLVLPAEVKLPSRSDLNDIAFQISPACFNLMQEIRNEEIVYITNAWEMQIKNLNKDFEEKTEKRKAESREWYEEQLALIKTNLENKLAKARKKANEAYWIEERDMITTQLANTQCQANGLYEKIREYKKQNTALENKLKETPEALRKKTKIIAENRTLKIRIRELEDKLCLDPTT